LYSGAVFNFSLLRLNYQRRRIALVGVEAQQRPFTAMRRIADAQEPAKSNNGGAHAAGGIGQHVDDAPESSPSGLNPLAENGYYRHRHRSDLRVDDPAGSVSAIAGGLGGCGGASFRTGFGFGLGFCFDFVRAAMQVQVEAPLEPLGCEFLVAGLGGLGARVR